MTQQFFPPDVSVRYRGDRDVAQTHFKDARNLLFKALNIGNNPASLIRHFDDGSTVHVLILGNQKIITIYAEKPITSQEPLPAPLIPPVETMGSSRLLMLSGWTRTHTIVAGALHEYEPSPPIVGAYDFDPGWQDVVQLNTAGSPQVATIRPSQYSGVMKRVVQAMLGVGMYTDESPSYISGAVTTGERAMVVNYKYQWSGTHGVYKAGPQNHWIIEVGLTNGMLAMPLITIPFTRQASFRKALVDVGDTDTLKVVDEFGGIPSGETFPSGGNLTAAIAQGKVLRLLTAEELAPFYTGHLAVTSSSGWAFPETGRSLHNTNWTTVRETQFVDFLGFQTKFALYAEHWKIDFSLSAHDIAAPSRVPAEPVGTGSATLTQLRSGRVSYLCFERLAIPWGVELRNLASVSLAGSRSDYWDYPGAPAATPYPGADLNEWGADLFVYFDGDRLERVKWVPKVSLDYGRGQKLDAVGIPAPIDDGEGCGYTWVIKHSIEQPFYRRLIGARELFSPEAFVSSRIDVREACLTMQQPPRAFRSAPYGSGLGDAYEISNYAVTPPYPNDRYDDGCFIFTAAPHDLSSLTFGTGNQGLAFSYGNGVEIYTVLCVTPFLREGHAISVQRVEYTPADPELGGGNAVGAVDYRDYALIDVAGFGVERISVPQYNGRSVGSPYAPSRLVIQVSARQTEYHRDASIIFTGSTLERPVATSTGARNMTAVPPEKMNWVGAPD